MSFENVHTARAAPITTQYRIPLQQLKVRSFSEKEIGHVDKDMEKERIKRAFAGHTQHNLCVQGDAKRINHPFRLRRDVDLCLVERGL